MKMCTVEELQKNLQVLANQVGSKRFTTAKNLMLEGLVIVDADGNPVYQGIDQSKLVPLLTAALQEAIAKIETLEARLTAAGIE